MSVTFVLIDVRKYCEYSSGFLRAFIKHPFSQMRRRSKAQNFDHGEQSQEKKTQPQRCLGIGGRTVTDKVPPMRARLIRSSEESSAGEASNDENVSSDEEVSEEDEERSDDEDDIIQKGTLNVLGYLTFRTRRSRLCNPR